MSKRWATRLLGGFAGLFCVVYFSVWWGNWQPEKALENEAIHISRVQFFQTESLAETAPPNAVDSEQLTRQWQDISLPYQMTPRLTDKPDAADKPRPLVTWIRFQAPTLTSGVRENASGGQAPRLYIPRIQSSNNRAVYSNGTLVFRSHPGGFWNTSNLPLLIDMTKVPGSQQTGEVLLRIEHNSGNGNEAISTLWYGTDRGISRRFLMRYILQLQIPYTATAGFLLTGLFSLLVWVRHRDKALHLLFFSMSVVSFIRTIPNLMAGNGNVFSIEWVGWLVLQSQFWVLAVVHFFLNYLHRRPSRSLDISVVLVTLGMGVITMPMMLVWPVAQWFSINVPSILLVTAMSIGLAGIIQSLHARTANGLLLGSWCWMSLIFSVHDWLLLHGILNIEYIYISPYANVASFLLAVKILFQHYDGAIEEVNLVNSSLEHRLQLREKELMESYQKQRESAHLQALSKERQRIMQDMHDGMGSSLRTALWELEKGKLDPHMVAEILSSCIEDLKLAIDAIEPVQADLLLLLATLRFRLGPRIENAGLTLRWEVVNVPPLDWIDPTNALHILRILQEAFTNIIKHTAATTISVATAVDDGWVILSITDNGSGFDMATANLGRGRGLGNQMRRAESIGAEIAWTSSAAGTTLTLRLPIRNPHVEPGEKAGLEPSLELQT